MSAGERSILAPSLETFLKLILLGLGVGLTVFLVGIRFYRGYEESALIAHVEADHLEQMAEQASFENDAAFADFINSYSLHWKAAQTEESGAKGVFRKLVSRDGRHVVLRLDSEKIWNGLVEENKMMLVLAILMLLASVQIAALFAYSVTRPLQRLAWGFRQLSSGLSARLPECRFAAHELIHLTNAFNEMSEQLHHWREVQKHMVKMDHLASLGEMASGIAHEIRNPLASMRIHLDLLRAQLAGDEKSCGRLGVFEEELGRLERKLNRFLDFARQGSNRREEIAPEELLQWVHRMLLSSARDKGIGIRITPCGGDCSRLLFHGDPDELRQALLNLALNGMQAMESGGVLTLALALQDDKVVFSVEDTGCGISEKIRGRIFEPFVTSRSEGTGLGLAIVRRTVEDHGGVLDFTTSPSGSRFFMTLPFGNSPAKPEFPKAENEGERI